MRNLARQVNVEDVFNQNVVDEELVKEYYERNERKKADEKWLKANRHAIINGLASMGKTKSDFGDIRVSYTEPDQSSFNEEKVLAFLLEKGMYEMATKRVLDEDALTTLIEQGLIDLEELKEVAWEERKGSPRLTIKRVKSDD